jgi:hypothetical protein
VQEHLRHQDIGTTVTYTRLAQHDSQKAVAVFEPGAGFPCCSLRAPRGSGGPTEARYGARGRFRRRRDGGSKSSPDRWTSRCRWTSRLTRTVSHETLGGAPIRTAGRIA